MAAVRHIGLLFLRVRPPTKVL